MNKRTPSKTQKQLCAMLTMGCKYHDIFFYAKNWTRKVKEHILSVDVAFLLHAVWIIQKQRAVFAFLSIIQVQ